MRWSEINGQWWTVPAERSKSRRRQRKPLSAAALAVLAKLDRRADPFAGCESRLSHWWLRTRPQLGLHDLRVHDCDTLPPPGDLRRRAARRDRRHAGPWRRLAAMTARYAHVADG